MNIEDGADIADHTAHIQRDAAGGDRLARNAVDQVLLVARRIERFGEIDLHARSGSGVGNSLGRLVIMPLQRDGRFCSAQMLLDGLDRLNNLRRMALHCMPVRPQQRLTLDAVDDKMLRLTLQLHMGRKPCAASANDARRADFLN